MTCAHDDRRRIQFVEVKQDFDMRELVQPLQGLGLEIIRKGDARLGASPEVILHAGTSGFNEADGAHLDVHEARKFCRSYA
jgi:hypothetical protein